MDGIPRAFSFCITTAEGHAVSSAAPGPFQQVLHTSSKRPAELCWCTAASARLKQLLFQRRRLYFLLLVSRSKLGTLVVGANFVCFINFILKNTGLPKYQATQLSCPEGKRKKITLKLQTYGAIQMSSKFFVTRFMVTFIRYWAQRQESWKSFGLKVRKPESSPVLEASSWMTLCESLYLKSISLSVKGWAI